MIRILFVDDDENLLKSLKVMLYSMRSLYEMSFVARGEDAVALLGGEDVFDLIVSDIHMPGMDGIELLTRFKESSPGTVRLILSGNLDPKTLSEASAVAHQVLAKPCEAQHLRSVITRTAVLRQRFAQCALTEQLVQLGTLPSAPLAHWEIMNEMQAPEPSIIRIGEIIEKDPGMSAKVLQIVNVHSGPSLPISNITEAVEIIGLEHLQSFVLVSEMFSQASETTTSRNIALDVLWQHGLTVAEWAKTIAEIEMQSKETIDDAYTAGLLHEVGLLILASQMPDELSRASAHAEEHQLTLQQAEQDIFGVTHGELGGYLLDLWGLPESVVDAIAYHYAPSQQPDASYEEAAESGFTPVTAVHVANYFCEERGDAMLDYGDPRLDVDHLEELELLHKTSMWWDACNSSG